MAMRDVLETKFSVANTDNIAMPQIPTPSRIANTPPALSLDQRSFYTTKAWIYDRFSAYPEVNTQVVNPWTYDPQWRLEERDLIGDAEAMVRAIGERPPVPGARPAPTPLPPDVPPMPGFEEPFFEDPDMAMRLINRYPFFDLFGSITDPDLTRPGAMLETRFDLADDLTDDDFSDAFRAAKDWNELLKEEGATPWPGEPSNNPRLTATSKDPVVYLNWPERQIHLRILNTPRSSIPEFPPGGNDTWINGPEAYATPGAIGVAVGVTALGATLIIASETFVAIGLGLKIVVALYEFAGIEPPSELETMADVYLIVGGILSIHTLIRLIPEGIPVIVGATKLGWMGIIFSLGAGIAIWGFLKQDWGEVWELIDECRDEGGSLLDCTVEVIVPTVVSWYTKAGKNTIVKVIEVAEPVLEAAAKSLAPLLIVGGAAVALVLFAKRKVGL